MTCPMHCGVHTIENNNTVALAVVVGSSYGFTF